MIKRPLQRLIQWNKSDMNNESWLKRNFVAIVGFAINLILLGVFIGKQIQINDSQNQIMQMIVNRQSDMDRRINEHHEDTSMHTNAEWRSSVLNTLNRVEGKIDAHIMRDAK